MYLGSTVPESALETVEMAKGARVCPGGLELQLQRLHRCCSRERAARCRHVMTGEVRAAARTGGLHSAWTGRRALKRGHFAR